MVEGARLERVYRGNSIEGSNPSLSATTILKPLQFSRFGRLLSNKSMPLDNSELVFVLDFGHRRFSQHPLIPRLGIAFDLLCGDVASDGLDLSLTTTRIRQSRRC